MDAAECHPGKAHDGLGWSTRTPLEGSLETRPQHGLARSLTLGHATLYGLGVTIGAGIYVLVGAAAARAGMHAPLAFVAAALLLALSAASFAELAGRFPVAAGEAAYVREAFSSPRLGTVVGLLVVAIAVVSAAAISVGSAGYIAAFIPLPSAVIISVVVLAMGSVAAWGVKESVSFAAVMTIIEIGGLLLLIGAGLASEAEVFERLPEMVPSAYNPALFVGLVGATLLAVFAFVGFEALANVAEEVQAPHRNVPRAIFLTVTVATVLYVAVTWVALITVGPAELATSNAPLALVFQRLTGASPATMSAVAIVATLNGIIVQIIMSSRVIYGLSRQGELPAALGTVHQSTRTPLLATALTTACVLGFALLLPLGQLADVTARLTLVVFASVNISLIQVKAQQRRHIAGAYVAPSWVPWAGAATCILLLLLDMATWATA